MYDTHGRALNPTELSNARYLDALIAFRPETCLRMEEEGGAGDGGGTGGDGGAGGDGGQGQQQQQQQSGPQHATDSQGRDLGFPANTPVAEMTDKQAAAYWRNQSRVQEGRVRGLTGDRSFDDTKAALDAYKQIQQEQMTPAEKALAEARDTGKAEGLKAARSEAATAIFRGMLEANGVSSDDADDLVGNLNVGNFISERGIETAKLTAFAKRFTPGKGASTTTQRRDFGGGSRQEGSSTPGSAGRAEAERRFGKKQ